METKGDMKFLEGKESAFASVLFFIAVVVFIVPIIIVFSLRFIYKSVQKAKENIAIPDQLDAKFNKVY